MPKKMVRDHLKNKIGRAPLFEQTASSRLSNQTLYLGYLTAHRTNSLVLLPSGPHTVRRVLLRKTQISSLLIKDCSKGGALP